MKNRDKQIVKAITESGFTYNEVKYKPLSARTLLLLERIESPFLTNESGLKGLLDFLAISSLDNAKISELIESGKWDDFILLEFSENYSSFDIANIAKILEEHQEVVNSTVVEVKTDITEKK